MRVLLTLAAPALAVALILPVALLPTTVAAIVFACFWGMTVGSAVAAAWVAIWLAS